MPMQPPDALVLATMIALAILAASSCWYFSTQLKVRSPARTVLVLLTGFVFLITVLWAAVYYVSCVARLEMTFETMINGLWLPVLAISIVGLLATGLLFLMILRRGLSNEK